MPRLRVHNFAMSVDGFVAGPDQSLEHPLGVGGTRLHQWAFATRSARRMFGHEGGEGGVDDDMWRQGDEGVGATIMGRSMFGPVRGPWPDESWRGWWGDEPPYHHPVFVLTHHPRPSVEMQGGTTFHFVDGGIEVALERAVEAAGGRDVRIGGGASTVRQYLRAGLVDLLHLAIAPVLLGSGQRLFEDLSDLPEAYQVAEVVGSPRAAHVRVTKRS
jgi:dihydrofolate reductase